ncbi:MAG: aldehyde dehydrogenase [Acidimicrobiales bacterium]|nr:aldehyde dehydrogenase [Acidimicrobiales bacterium]
MTEHLPVRKTYKLYIGGQFPRSESGRSYPVTAPDGTVVRVAEGSRKDVRDAVRAARSAQPGWAAKTAYNRGQILYRVAEVLEGRRSQFPAGEVQGAIDRWVWYAGWTDKIQQVSGSLNPVAGPYWNVTAPEAVGVVGIAAPESPSLLGLVSRLAPALVGGNTVVVLASEASPLPAVDLAEVLATSDVPGGVVNIITGHKAELLPWLAGHFDVDSIDVTGVPDDLLADVEREAAANVKRVVRPEQGPLDQSPHDILRFMEHKTVWHPVGS